MNKWDTFWMNFWDWFGEWYGKQVGAGTAVNMTEVYLNADEAKRILNEMKSRAETIREQKSSMQQLSAATEECWLGVSGDALREKLAALINEQEAIATDLEEMVQMMLQDVRQIEDTDHRLATSISASSGNVYSSGGGRHA